MTQVVEIYLMQDKDLPSLHSQNIIAANDLATQGARASATMKLTRLTGITCAPHVKVNQVTIASTILPGQHHNSWSIYHNNDGVNTLLDSLAKKLGFAKSVSYLPNTE